MFLALVLASNFSIVYRHALDIYFILYIFFFIIAKCLAILKILSSKLLTQQHIIQLAKKFIFCSKPHFVHYSIYQIYILNCKKTLYLLALLLSKHSKSVSVSNHSFKTLACFQSKRNSIIAQRLSKY